MFKKEIVDLGGARIISEAMTRFLASEPMQAWGCIATWSISVLRSLKEKVGRHAITPALNGMSACMSSQKVCKEGIGCLKCLSLLPRNKEILQEEDAMDLIYHCMWSHSEVSAVQQSSLAVLSNISVDVESEQVSQITTTDLDAIVNAMRTHWTVKGVQESAIILLRNYAFSPNNFTIMQDNSFLVGLIHAAMAKFNDSFRGRAEDLLRILPSLGQ